MCDYLAVAQIQRKACEASAARERSSFPCPAECLAGEALGTLPCPEPNSIKHTELPMLNSMGNCQSRGSNSFLTIFSVGNILSTAGESANVKITCLSENLAAACFETDVIDIGDQPICIPHTFQEFESFTCVYHFAALLPSILLGKDSVERSSTGG